MGNHLKEKNLHKKVKNAARRFLKFSASKEAHWFAHRLWHRILCKGKYTVQLASHLTGLDSTKQDTQESKAT